MANRHPFARVQAPIIAGRAIASDPVEREQQQFSELRRSGWDGDRAISRIRKNIRTDKDGNKFLNRAGMDTPEPKVY